MDTQPHRHKELLLKLHRACSRPLPSVINFHHLLTQKQDLCMPHIYSVNNIL